MLLTPNPATVKARCLRTLLDCRGGTHGATAALLSALGRYRWLPLRENTARSPLTEGSLSLTWAPGTNFLFLPSAMRHNGCVANPLTLRIFGVLRVVTAWRGWTGSDMTGFLSWFASYIATYMSPTSACKRLSRQRLVPFPFYYALNAVNLRAISLYSPSAADVRRSHRLTASPGVPTSERHSPHTGPLTR